MNGGRRFIFGDLHLKPVPLHPPTYRETKSGIIPVHKHFVNISSFTNPTQVMNARTQ